MKYIFLVLGLLLIVSCAHVPENSSPSLVNIDGTWKGVYDSKGKDGQPPKLFILKFKSDGGILTGTGCDATSKPDEWKELDNVKIKGNILSFTSIPTPGMSFNYKGKIEGDIINLTFKYYTPGGTVSDGFTVKREK
jgi:hypothetical protein